jgi:hypothetical protein
MGANVSKSIAALSAALLLCGCSVAPKDLTGFNTSVSNVFALTSAATALDQVLAEEFVKQSAELEFLSKNGNRGETCRDNDDPIIREIGNVEPKSIQKREEARIKLRLAELYLIKKYADTLAAYVEKRDDRIQYLNDMLAIADTLSHSAIAPPEAKVIGAGARVVGNAFIALHNNYTELQLRRAAEKMRPTLAKMVGALKRNFHLVPDRTQLYLNAWRNCAEEKFRYMRDRPYPSLRANVVELDNSYSVFQTQLRTYINSVPQMGEALDKIVKANEAIIEVSSDEMLTAAKQLVASIDGVIAAYNTAKTLPDQIRNAR